MITQQSLKDVLNYEPITGLFTWVKDKGPNAQAGSIAGYPGNKRQIYICINGKAHLAHRLAWLYMNGEMPVAMIDHIDGNPSNNVYSNLRQANASENSCNAKSRGGKSSYKGVTWHNQKKKWRARICKEGKRFSLGLYATETEAYEAYCKASSTYHQEFSRLA